MNEQVNTVKGGAGWKPQKWIAIILAFFMPPLAMLYLGRLVWALVYLVLVIGVVILRFTVLKTFTESDLWWLPGVIPVLAIFHVFMSTSYVVKPRRWFSRWYGLVSISLIFFVPLVAYRAFYSETFRIPSGAMMPTINIGDLVQAKKWGCGNYQYSGIKIYQTQASESCQINKGDLIVFEYPPNPKDIYIKRVMAVGGDYVEYIDKEVVINDQPILTEWIKTEGRFDYFQETLNGVTYQVLKIERANHRFQYVDVSVPDGHLFVMGDNRDNSSDSRVWGLVPIENVIGKLELK